MTETPKPGLDGRDGTQAGPDAPALPVRRLEPPALIPARPRKARRKARKAASGAPDPGNVLLQDTFIFLTPEERGRS